jgi:hypothetical protein
MLTAGAIEALLLVGSDLQKQRYVRKLIESTWTRDLAGFGDVNPDAE